MNDSIDVSIIIVNYNTKELTRNCLLSVFRQTKDIQFEVIVTDNGSTDGSIEMIKIDFPQVALIENNANLGFGAANNRGLKIARGKYIFYLNSDTVLLNNAVKIFFDYWENSENSIEIGALGGILEDAFGNPIHSAGKLPTYLDICLWQLNILRCHIRNSILKFCGLNWFYQFVTQRRSHIDKNVRIGEVGYITGADLFLRNDENAYFDERYFLYYEESDLELGLAKHNLKRILIDGPRIIHLTYKSNPHFNISSFSLIQAQISSIKYAKKNLNTQARLLSFLIKLDWINPYVYHIYKNTGGLG